MLSFAYAECHVFICYAESHYGERCGEHSEPGLILASKIGANIATWPVLQKLN